MESFSRSVDPIEVKKGEPGDSVDNILGTDNASGPIMGEGCVGDADDHVFVEALPTFQPTIHQAATTYTALTPSASNSQIFNWASRYIEAANASSPSRLHRPGNRSQHAEDTFEQFYMSDASEGNRTVSD